MKDRLDNPAINQGYTPEGAENGKDGIINHKEAYEHRRFQNQKCPSDEEMKGFKTFMDNFYQKCHKLSLEVLRALGLILNLPPTFFDNYMARSDAQFRILHYMPVPVHTLLSERHARIHPHTDFGFCTILFQDSVGGLEIDPFHTKSFLPATPIPGTCVINIADLLQRLSNDRLRSTLHRVVAPPLSEEKRREIGEDGMLPPRYSAAFFVHPSPDITIEPLVGVDEEPKYAPVNAGEWRTGITASNYALPVST
ncbi:2-oxoglutarate-dependent dioxygenase [Hyphodiscus hymeniophilus]|uniref:2-oxoglutarate-dependent dioxygenase n=1 Tax=Hyphodiscus hymeniophilus TaxID=353542 RepID=A0A9P6SKY4_9HELO|nr:2-oxoglutarate-dependent dioxygenase [Hyphodiscus hymeniophilus]